MEIRTRGGVDVVLVDRFQVDGDTIEIWQYGRNDYEVRYLVAGMVHQGTLMQVMQDLHDCYRVFDN